MACDLGQAARHPHRGGSAAALKLWRRAGSLCRCGGRISAVRSAACEDVELADLDGDGTRELVVATHDQGVRGGGAEDGAGNVHERGARPGSEHVRARGRGRRSGRRRRSRGIRRAEPAQPDGRDAAAGVGGPLRPARRQGRRVWRISAPDTPRRSSLATSTGTAAMSCTSRWRRCPAAAWRSCVSTQARRPTPASASPPLRMPCAAA